MSSHVAKTNRIMVLKVNDVSQIFWKLVEYETKTFCEKSSVQSKVKPNTENSFSSGVITEISLYENETL